MDLIETNGGTDDAETPVVRDVGAHSSTQAGPVPQHLSSSGARYIVVRLKFIRGTRVQHLAEHDDKRLS